MRYTFHLVSLSLSTEPRSKCHQHHKRRHKHSKHKAAGELRKAEEDEINCTRCNQENMTFTKQIYLTRAHMLCFSYSAYISIHRISSYDPVPLPDCFRALIGSRAFFMSASHKFCMHNAKPTNKNPKSYPTTRKIGTDRTHITSKIPDTKKNWFRCEDFVPHEQRDQILFSPQPNLIQTLQTMG